ncbi:MAG: virulence factor TspB C-terminal domain-related protein [Gallionellaceae bacterium]|jgi:hypothetical protein
MKNILRFIFLAIISSSALAITQQTAPIADTDPITQYSAYSSWHPSVAGACASSDFMGLNPQFTFAGTSGNSCLGNRKTAPYDTIIIGSTTSREYCPPDSPLANVGTTTASWKCHPIVPCPVDIANPWHYVSQTLMCERNQCPNAGNDGYHFVVGGLVGTTPPAGEQFCDASTGCEVSITSSYSVFKMGIIQSQSLNTSCKGAATPAPTSVSLPPVTADQASSFSQVKSLADLVDPVQTQKANSSAAAAIIAADIAHQKLILDTATAQAAVNAQTVAKSEVQDAAIRYAASSTVENFNAYNSAVSNFNSATSTAKSALTVLNSSYASASATADNVRSVSADAATKSKNLTDLQTAITATGAGFDNGEITTKTQGATDLAINSQDASTASNQLNNELNSAMGTSTNITNVTNNNYSTVNNIVNNGTPAPSGTASPTVDPATPSINAASATAPAVAPVSSAPININTEGLATETTLQSVINAITNAASSVTAKIDAMFEVPTYTEDTLTEQTVNVQSITPVLDGALGVAGTCPTMTYTIAGQTKTYMFTWECKLAEGIKPIVLAMAWLAAAGLLMNSFKVG